MSGPLAGTRVVDLTRLLPGDYATCLLADLGADVVKVEQPGVGDGLRTAPPYDTHGVSGAHTTLNRGKRSVTLDLKQPAGRAVLLELLAGADVLVDSFRPGVLERLGLGRPVLEHTNPRLVHVAITFFGHESPLAEVAGHDLNAQALAGLLSLAEGPQGGPSRPYVQAADHAVGLQAALAAVAALHARERTGQGAFCDLAMTDAAYSMLGLAAGAYAATGASPSAHETLTGGLACYGTYACSDGRQLAVGALEPVFFRRLVAALGLPEDLCDSQYVHSAQGTLRAQMAEVLGRRPRADWLRDLAEVDCCVTPVHDVTEALTDPAAEARGLVQRQSDGAPARLAPVPRFPGVDAAAVAGRRAPRLGEHTAEVLAELGHDTGAITRLRQEGVL